MLCNTNETVTMNDLGVQVFFFFLMIFSGCCFEGDHREFKSFVCSLLVTMSFQIQSLSDTTVRIHRQTEVLKSTIARQSCILF